LFALFLSVALLPLLLSDWVASSAVSRVVADLHASSRAQTTRQVSRQVFDRLQAGKTLLVASAATPAIEALPGLGRVFKVAYRFDDAGQPIDTTELAAAWHEAVDGAARAVPLSLADDGAGVAVRLRVLAMPRQPTRVLLSARRPGGGGWLAEIDPAYLWEPLADMADDSDWTVSDARGRELVRRAAADPAPADGAAAQATQARLFLGAEFGAGDWLFEQRGAAPAVRWLGVSLLRWQALVGAGTLALIALLSLWRIRRALRPLQQLTEGTRQLARGATQTRVAVRGQDELGVLAQSFNHMADRLEAQFDELAHRASHDSLTGLANRRGLHDHLDAALSAGAPGASTAVLFVDLDHFKDINDSQGHEAGDELLCLAAERLCADVGPAALVARQGGDEFVLVLSGVTTDAAVDAARGVVRCLGEPFRVRGVEHVLGASVGVAMAPADGRTREELLRCADIALYAAKAAGRGQYVVFSPELDDAARERIRLQGELRQALERGEFILYYQPRIEPVAGRMTSAEALLRWQHPQRGLLLPASFIELAEESALIEVMGAWVLDEACAQMARWREQGRGLRRVSVNVSPRQLISGQLPGQVRAALGRHALPAQALELELTESLLTGNVGDAVAQLAELRDLGVSIALDDFGTGYSSMAMLRQLPIDVMKIDRAFVRDLGVAGADGEGALAIIRAIVAMAHSMRLHLVAEGIETATQAAVLREMGCDEFQGFFFGKPVPAAQLPLSENAKAPETAG
jgi:diguanylate cyclase (GGDEF)-like protein